MNSMDGTAPQANVAARDRAVHDFTEEANIGLELLGAGPEEPVGRFRRRLERVRGVAEGDPLPQEDESELRLPVLLLREENARLESARHATASPGTTIERQRALGEGPDPERLDDATAILGECLVIRDGLDQTCVEVLAAMDAVRARPPGLTQRLDETLGLGSAERDDIRLPV